ncbi:hypothetical protein JTE90_012917 [Oedothorax gibbosus]|uniref:Nucleoside diphosphate kinase homolog 5 n=1 Tax=Oedothorax gibbosus TaxID=931172 RepID=A0AAV6UZS3_9ARAC|nr:hypothetical protein JTE90_012917 [Oedothorax gibbosus]
MGVPISGTSTKTQGVKEDVIVESGAYLSKTVNPVLLKGLIQLCRQKPDNPLVWLADWLLANNPNIAKTS